MADDVSQRIEAACIVQSTQNSLKTKQTTTLNGEQEYVLWNEVSVPLPNYNCYV